MGISRITDSMMNYGFLSGMNKSLNAQYSLMEQMSDGKRIHRPSDDPVSVIRSLQYRSAIMQNEQFVSNVKDAQSWMEMTDKATGDLSDLVSQAKSLVVRAIAPNSEIGYAAAAKQLDGLINQCVQVANTKIGDRYIFAGNMDKTQPFERVMLSDPTGQSNLQADTVVYYGDDKKISMVTQSGIANEARDGVNLTGIDVFGRTASTGTQYGQATTDVFNALIRIKEELEKTAAVTKTNSLGGTLDVDGGYTGPAAYQDFAVKIDALKVRLNSYAQTNTTGGSLALSWTGKKTAMPAYASPNSLRMRIDALKVSANVAAPVGHTTGALTLESTSNTIPVAASGALQFRVDAVQVETGNVRQSNPLAGNLQVLYNGFTGTPPANLLVKAVSTPAANVVQTNAAGGALTVTGISGSAEAATKVRIDSVAAGSVTGASYFDTVSNSWQSATVVAGAPSTLTLGTTGMTASIASVAGNAAGDEYTLNATKRVTGVEYSLTGTWPGIAAAGTFVTQSNATGGAATVAPNQAIPYMVKVTGVVANKVTGANISTDGGLTWSAATVTAGAGNATVTLANGAGMTITDSAGTLVNDTYESKVPPSFTLTGTGMQISIADSTENGSGAANVYTIPLTSTGKVMQASYSTDGGGTWTAATADNSANPFRFSLGGSFAGVSAQLGTVSTNTVGDVHTITPVVTAPTGHITGAFSIAAAADTVIPAAELQFRVDSINAGTGQVMTASYSTDKGATWVAAAPDVPANPVNFTLMGGVTAQLGAVTTNVVGDVHTIRMTDGTVAQASYSTDGGGTWAKATVDTASPDGAFLLGNTGFAADIAKNSTNNGTNIYTLSDLSIDAATETAALSYSLDKGNNWTKAAAPAVTQSTPDSGALSLGGHYTGLPAFQDLVVTAQAWKVSTTAINQTNTAGGAMKIAYNDTLVTPMPAVNPHVRIDTVDTSGHVTALSSSIDGGLTWQSATAQSSIGPTVFALDAATYAGFSITIADNAANAANDTYTAVGSTMVAGDPALVSYTTKPAPDVNGTLAASTPPVWSMKGANPTVQDFALPDGVTANIAANTATVLGTSTYSFRIPPRFELASGLKVSVDPNANNAVKDAHTFHMARDTEHTEASATMGPDLDWLSDKGLADLDAVHDQILTAVVDVGTKSSMYEMTGNMLESSNVNLTSVLSTNEDLDMAKAIIDLKTAENTYKAALSFGARIMPTSLVDFLR